LVNTERIAQRLEYIHQNPIKQFIVELSHEYLFSSTIDYADGKGLKKIPNQFNHSALIQLKRL